MQPNIQASVLYFYPLSDPDWLQSLVSSRGGARYWASAQHKSLTRCGCSASSSRWFQPLYSRKRGSLGTVYDRFLISSKIHLVLRNFPPYHPYLLHRQLPLGIGGSNPGRQSLKLTTTIFSWHCLAT